MRNQKIRLGSIIILFALVSVILVTLAVLGLSSANADYAVARRYRDSVKEQYELSNMGVDWLAKTESGIMDEPVTTEKILVLGNRQLNIVLSENPDGTYDIKKWKMETVREENQGLNVVRLEGGE